LLTLRMPLGQRSVCVPTASGLSRMEMKIYKVSPRRMPRYTRVVYHQKRTRTRIMSNHKHGRSSQEDPRPVLMGFEETKEPGALGERGKQGPIVARQPARAGTVAHAFEGVEQPQRDYFTGPEVGLGMCGDGASFLIELIEQRGDQLHGGHTAL